MASNLVKYYLFIVLVFLVIIIYNFVFYSNYSADICKTFEASNQLHFNIFLKETRILLADDDEINIEKAYIDPNIEQYLLFHRGFRQMQDEATDEAVEADEAADEAVEADEVSDEADEADVADESDVADEAAEVQPSDSKATKVAATSTTSTTSAESSGEGGANGNAKQVDSSVDLVTIPLVIVMVYGGMAGLTLIAIIGINSFAGMNSERFGKLPWYWACCGFYVRNFAFILKIASYLAVMIFVIPDCKEAVHTVIDGQKVTQIKGDMYNAAISLLFGNICLWGATHCLLPLIKKNLDQEAFLYEPYDSSVNIAYYILCNVFGP